MYLIDTTVFSETTRKRPNPQVKTWYAQTPREDVWLSVIVIGEIRRGAERLVRRGDLSHRKLEAWLGTMERQFTITDRILGIDAEVAHEWGRLMAHSPDHPTDTWLAAQARVRNLQLVTRNIRHFKCRDVQLLNPFEPAP